MILIKKMLFLASIAFLIFQCDPELYYGYDNEAQELINTTKISGTVTNFYTGAPVTKALVRIGDQETLTDYSGSYTITYVVDEDEKRNKYTAIEIQSDNYYSYTDSTLLLPTENTFDIQLVYAAPVILNTARIEELRWRDTIPYWQYTSQAVVLNYSGVDRITEATISFYSSGPSPDSTIMDLALVKTGENNLKAFYHLDYKFADRLAEYYNITVRNNAGFSDRLFHSLDPRVPDTLLFKKH